MPPVAPDDVIGQIVATPRAPRRVLDDLAAIAPPPELELHLLGGQVLRGRFAAIADDAGTACVTLHTGGPPRAPQLAWVRVDQIAAVVVTDASVFVRVAPREPAPSKLELARALGARAESLTTTLGRALPLTTHGDLDDDARRAVAQVVPALVDALRAIGREPLGKQALDGLSGVELGAAAQPEIRRDAAKLIVLAARAPLDAWPAARLRVELEKLL